jgi:hypothetical protein
VHVEVVFTTEIRQREKFPHGNNYVSLNFSASAETLENLFVCYQSRETLIAFLRLFQVPLKLFVESISLLFM